MTALDFEKNAPAGENGVGKIEISTSYDGTTYPEWDGTAEQAVQIIGQIEEANTFADVGYFENFSTGVNLGDVREIGSDYCEAGVINKKADKIPNFSFDWQEVLDLENFALMIGEKYVKDTLTNEEYIMMTRASKTLPFQAFRFTTCPKNGYYNRFYYIKTSVSSDISIPFINLARNDFEGTSMEFEVDLGGNFYMIKNIPVSTEPTTPPEE